MTNDEHIQTARRIAATINHVKPYHRALVVKEWAEHMLALFKTPPVTIRGQGKLVCRDLKGFWS
jgi:hypothetical protein